MIGKCSCFLPPPYQIRKGYTCGKNIDFNLVMLVGCVPHDTAGTSTLGMMSRLS
ncbi:Nicotinate phosphoribosyltransferase [Clarias magur]|uniref:Nicotinate phosphoribosyltransferase n=1 Tax=Clarias magur TaxID=1594786 RepID=A0A8J4ULW7_CLAMG|nr:Nicotinate phosphoribosyltransferase [Clarias magur]